MGGAHWLVIHVAKNREAACAILRILEQEGFLARMQPLRARDDAQEGFFEITALHSEASEARALLLEQGY